MVAQSSRTHKVARPVLVRAIDVHAGVYAAQSTDGVSWYRVDVRERSCSCAAGQNGFARVRIGMCRHMVAARYLARTLASMVPAARTEALRMAWRIKVDHVDIAALSEPLRARKAVA